jgi:hypothetical protein
MNLGKVRKREKIGQETNLGNFLGKFANEIG